MHYQNPDNTRQEDIPKVKENLKPGPYLINMSI